MQTQTSLRASGTAQYLLDIQQAVEQISLDAVESLIALLLEAAQAGKTIYLIGNGGSAATASHFACDLSKGTRGANRPWFRVVALTDNVPLITAWANDVDYADVFAEQLRNLCLPGDILIAISGSGNSPNILRAAAAATAAGATIVALTGAGGRLGPVADLWLQTPAGCIEQVEDLHLIVEHLVCRQLRERL
jgi:D-sedoheptulose 7-phosphate isomerase